MGSRRIFKITGLALLGLLIIPGSIAAADSNLTANPFGIKAVDKYSNVGEAGVLWSGGSDNQGGESGETDTETPETPGTPGEREPSDGYIDRDDSIEGGLLNLTYECSPTVGNTTFLVMNMTERSRVTWLDEDNNVIDSTVYERLTAPLHSNLVKGFNIEYNKVYKLQVEGNVSYLGASPYTAWQGAQNGCLKSVDYWDEGLNLETLYFTFSNAPQLEKVYSQPPKTVKRYGSLFWGNQSATRFLDISGWDTSNVTDMGNIFASNTSFNQDISNWNISNVTSLDRAFNGASSFNQDIGKWNTSKVTNIQGLFNNARNFEQDLSSWNLDAVTIDGSPYLAPFTGATKMNANPQLKPVRYQ